MTWTPELRDFIQQHLNDDTSELLLAARRYQGIDVPFAVEQIEARKRLKEKLPEWYKNKELIMGGRVPAEQCSSELTARYKHDIVARAIRKENSAQRVGRFCDMTGGMGVDFWYMSKGMDRAIYTEENEHLCEVARHNFKVLADALHPEVEVRCGDGRELPIPSVDVIYLDPARRAGDGSRVYAMEDCEPNIVEWQDELLEHAKMVLVKLSPMVDIKDVLRKLKGVREVHIVGVKNVTSNEPFFLGHFPQEPVMPGVLLVEAMAQAGGLLVLNSVDEPERWSTYFAKIDNVRFRHKVVPGDTLIFLVKLLAPVRRGISSMRGLIFVGDNVVAEAEFTASIVKNK